MGPRKSITTGLTLIGEEGVEIHLLSLFLLAIRSRVAGGWSGCEVRREGEELEQEVSELQRRGERSGSGRRVARVNASLPWVP